LASAQGLAQTEPPPDLDDYVARALKGFEVPGLAVAIVKDGKIALAKGYGARRHDREQHERQGSAACARLFIHWRLRMQSHLFIGGGKDGLSFPAPDSAETVQMPVGVTDSEIYVRESLSVGDALHHDLPT
jgi:hypothetical protein